MNIERKKTDFMTQYSMILPGLLSVIFFSRADVYYSKITGIIPLYYLVFFVILSVPIFLNRPRIILDFLFKINPLSLWCFYYLGISLFGLLYSSQSDVASQELESRIFSTLFLVVLSLLLSRQQSSRLSIRYAIFLALLLSVFNNVYEFFNLTAFDLEDLGRSTGFYGDPNNAAASINTAMILSIGLFKPRYRLLVIIIGGLGVFPTLSRGGILAWLLISLACFISNIIPRKQLIGLAIFPLLLSLFFSLFSSPIPQSSSSQLDFSSLDWLPKGSIVRLQSFTSFSEDSVSDGSTEARSNLVKLGFEFFSQKPLFGNGLASTREWKQYHQSTHNMYLYLMADHGIWGLLAFPLLIFLLFKSVDQEERILLSLFLANFLLYCFFSHTVVNSKAMIVCWAYFFSNFFCKPKELPVPIHSSLKRY